MNEMIVETYYGKIQGMDLGPVIAWKGIPYASPPVGTRRFQPPQPPDPWTGIRDTTAFGSISLQLPFLVANGTLEVEMPEPQSEDCLYLNVWAPRPDGKKRPVMVWVHGGALLNGSGSQSDYDGARFAEQGDVILVTINYRLGVLGFLYLAELAGEAYASAGNCGLLDQIAAFQWVRENIAAFGGDPDNITAFGFSAGARSIALLFGIPAARGLFQRAILESPLGNEMPNTGAASQKARKFLGILGLETNEIASLSTLRAEKLLAAQAHLLTDGRLGAIQPVLDGENLLETPLQALARGAAKDVALLIGTNRDEARLFTETITGEKRASPLTSTLVPSVLGTNALKILRTYAKISEDRWQDFLLEVVNDYAGHIPVIRLAEQQVRQGGQVWMYRFDWPSPHLSFGACHALEVPFVWNRQESAMLQVLLGANLSRDLARRMQAA
jgi:para-nitrobenzyl esterase